MWKMSQGQLNTLKALWWEYFCAFGHGMFPREDVLRSEEAYDEYCEITKRSIADKKDYAAERYKFDVERWMSHSDYTYD